MHRSEFWGLLSHGDRHDLAEAARPRTYQSGQNLCTEGEPSTHVFILLSGWVKIITDTREGQEILEALRREGEVIGEMAVHLNGQRTATIRALGTVRALLLGYKQFEAFLNLHPLAAHAHRQAMTAVQQASYEKQRGQALLSGSQRLAGLLLDLHEPSGRAEQPGPVDAPRALATRDAATPPPLLSQEELASLIGASRSTVTRALAGWRSRHIIGTDPRHTEILDRAALLRIARRDSKELLSAHGKPVILSNPPRESGPLSSGEL